MSRVRKLSEVLLTSAKYVHINKERARSVAEYLKGFDLSLPTWDWEPYYPRTSDFEEMCQYYLTFNAINYCYFDQDGKKFGNALSSGSTLAGLCITENWQDLSDPLFLTKVDENYLLSELFEADSPISLVKERVNALRELGAFLNSNFDFSFRKLFLKAHKNAYVVSQMIPTLLPSWRDPFFKRSQLFVGMVYGRFQHGENLPIDPSSLSDLTIFADYRVPQTLMAMGILEPSASLLTRLHCEQFLGSGSRKELELRAGSVLGADVLMEELQKRNSDANITPLHIDYLLWNAGHRRDDMPEGVFAGPFPNHHLTMTTDY